MYNGGLEQIMDNYDALVREYAMTDFPNLIDRDEIMRRLPSPEPFGLVHIITGMRRSGKTFYLFQKIRQLLDEGIPRERIFYFDFSDDRLKPLHMNTGTEVVEAFYRQFPMARTDGAYLFLDEIQELDDWQALCRRLSERERVTLVVTGSSSKLSSDEIATQFRGRSFSHEMMPLSFAEYIRFKRGANRHSETLRFSGSGTLSGIPCSQQEATWYEGAYEQYLEEGGFPQVQSSWGIVREERIQLLQSYMRDVVARDVTERMGNADISMANRIALYALRNTSCEFSVNGLVEQLIEDGDTAYWKKVDELVRLMEQAFLFHRVSEFSLALKRESTTPPKTYANDPGLAYAISRANQQDVGKRLEKAIYLELRRRLAGSRVQSISSFTSRQATGRKVDFIVGDALSRDPYELIQVSVSIANEKTRNREIKSLTEAMKETGLRTGTVITLREQESLQTDAGLIEVIPAWQWSLTDHS